MKKKMSFGCVFGAVIIILLSSMQLSVVSQTLEPYNELECVPDIYIKSDIGTEIEDLPYFLDDTILDGNMRVIVTKDGLPPRGSTPDDYDKVISLKEKNCIIEDARERFIGTYGIDPYISKDEKTTNLRFKEFINDCFTNRFNPELTDKYCMIKLTMMDLTK